MLAAVTLCALILLLSRIARNAHDHEVAWWDRICGFHSKLEFKSWLSGKGNRLWNVDEDFGLYVTSQHFELPLNLSLFVKIHGHIGFCGGLV